MSLPVYFHRNSKIPNLGDELSPYLVGKLAKRDVQRAEAETHPSALFAIGSIIGRTRFPSQVVWGSGFISAVGKLTTQPICTAVRGPLTLDRLGLEHNIPVGDPALLMPDIYHPAGIAQDIDIGIIPHHIDLADFKARFLPDDGASHQVLNIATSDVEGFIDQLLRCRFVFSSSLHGVILAHAYGIPALWMELSDKVIGGGYKFRDYFLSVSIPPYDAVDLRRGQIRLGALSALRQKAGARRGIVNYDKSGLLEAFDHALNSLDTVS
ncbi:MAG: polysaccharide pyruvyl transferase family protein [Rhodobacteraceae bacterium]|nr:polysaccharide pyruvyl transferase family protein [Paracoccaceae bacterium]